MKSYDGDNVTETHPQEVGEARPEIPSRTTLLAAEDRVCWHKTRYEFVAGPGTSALEVIQWEHHHGEGARVTEWIPVEELPWRARAYIAALNDESDTHSGEKWWGYTLALMEAITWADYYRPELVQRLEAALKRVTDWPVLVAGIRQAKLLTLRWEADTVAAAGRRTIEDTGPC